MHIIFTLKFYTMKTSFLTQSDRTKNEKVSNYWNTNNTDSAINTWNSENEEYDSDLDLTEKMAQELLSKYENN